MAASVGCGRTDLRGGVQKGPLILGSDVEISPVDASMDPKGSVYVTQTASDAGDFTVRVPSGGPLLMTGSGFYFNENDGSVSTAPITLRAYYDVAPETEATAIVNVVTHLSSRRVRQLVVDGAPFSDALAQAESELPAAIGLGPEGYVPASAAVEMDILAGDSEGAAWQLAVGAVLIRAAKNRDAGDGSTVDGQLQEILNSFAEDFADDGQLETNHQDELEAAERTVQIDAVRLGLGARLLDLGIDESVPDIDRFIDTDDDGLLNIDDPDIDGDGVDGVHAGGTDCDDRAVDSGDCGGCKCCTRVEDIPGCEP